MTKTTKTNNDSKALFIFTLPFFNRPLIHGIDKGDTLEKADRFKFGVEVTFKADEKDIAVPIDKDGVVRVELNTEKPGLIVRLSDQTFETNCKSFFVSRYALAHDNDTYTQNEFTYLTHEAGDAFILSFYKAIASGEIKPTVQDLRVSEQVFTQIGLPVTTNA